MEETTLVAVGGRPRGSGPARRLRAENRIPAVVYGHGSDPLSVSVDRWEFRTLVKAAGTNALINLDIDGDSQLSIIKELQQHPVKDRVLHIDFQLIRRDEAIIVEVPIEFIGEPTELIRIGGLMQQQMTSLTISAPAGEIPASVSVDVSELDEGGSIRVGDIALPSGVTADAEPEAVVVSGIVTRAAAAALDEDGLEIEDGAEGAEGAEASDEDGADEDGDS